MVMRVQSRIALQCHQLGGVALQKRPPMMADRRPVLITSEHEHEQLAKVLKCTAPPIDKAACDSFLLPLISSSSLARIFNTIHTIHIIQKTVLVPLQRRTDQQPT